MNFLDRIRGVGPQKRIYMDYAAATPLRYEAWEAMKPVFKDVYGNPSGIHKEGQQARKIIESAREQVARLLTVRSADVFFTSGGTESNNLAVAGVLEAAKAAGRDYSEMEVVTTKLEHPSLLRTVEAYAARGVVVHYTPVNEDGRIVIAEFQKLLSEKTVLVATALINSEIGVIQPTRKLKKLMKEVGDAVLVIDGAQAPLWHGVELESLGADVLTLDGGKFYGPKGIGVMARRHGVELAPSVFGGGQEGGLRPGTESAALIVGFLTAFEMAVTNQERRIEGSRDLQEYFFRKVSEISGAVINGSQKEGERVVNNINISIPGTDTEFAVVVLDEHGVACSTKSACSGAGGGESAVVKAISGDAARAKSTLRFTLGETSNKEEIDRVIEILKEHIEKMKSVDII